MNNLGMQTLIKRFQNPYALIVLLLAVLILVFVASPVSRLLFPTMHPLLGPQKNQISCPVPKEFCQKGKIITNSNGKVLGLGFTLPPGTSLNAVFSGKLQQGIQTATSSAKIKLEPHPIVWLYGGEGDFKDYIATYNFFGNPVSSFGSQNAQQESKTGEVIGIIGSLAFPTSPPYNGVNLIFSLEKDNKFNPPLSFEDIEFKE